MSTTAAATGFFVLVIGLMFALPLFFAGYEPRVNWNKELEPTVFTIENHIVDSTFCYRNCNCHKYCSGKTTSSASSCTTKCDRCAYICFSKSIVKSYLAEMYPISGFPGMGQSKTQKYTKIDYIGTTSSAALAHSQLSYNYPIGKQYKGYYRASMPWISVDTPYHDTTFLVFSIIFAIIALGGLGVCVVAGIAHLCNQN